MFAGLLPLGVVTCHAAVPGRAYAVRLDRAGHGTPDACHRCGQQGHRYTKLDYASSTAVALAQLAQYSGDKVGLIGYGRNIQQQLLPGRGAAHMRQFLRVVVAVGVGTERGGSSSRNRDPRSTSAAAGVNFMDYRSR